MMKHFWISLLLVGFCNAVFAQITIEGKVVDSLGKSVSFASVLLKSKQGGVLNFTRTNDKGDFKLISKAAALPYNLEVTSMGFQKQSVLYQTNQKSYTIVLKEGSINLPTVIVKNKPILTTQGDTLNYKTSDFADKQDRSIGDVLKKMPGVEVADDGKVSYNGRSISNLYVDGDNILDDKYNIATKAIPHGAVDKVQVIEKDQPIKLLRKNNTSDDVALNLVTTAAAKLKLIGDAKVGAGTPEKFDLGATGMMFKKKVKFINSLKANNIGENLANDLISHNFSDYLRAVENNRPENFLSAGLSNVPILPQNRTLFNKIGVANLNNLYKFSDALYIKANIAYLNDTQTQFYKKSSETYLPQDTFRYSETQDNRFKPQKIRTQFNLNWNEENNYLNNTLVLDYAPERISSNFIINNVDASQSLGQKTLNFSNDLSWRKKFKSEQMVNFYSYINSSNQPENLLVKPGLNQAFINNNQPYDGLYQEADLPTFFTNNYASFALTKGKFIQTYKAGFNFQSQNLNTQLYQLTGNDKRISLGENYANQLNWNKTKLYLEPNYDFVSDKLKFSLAVPLSYNAIDYSDISKSFNQSLNQFFINPRISAKIQSGIENYFLASYSFLNGLGGINDVYQGTVLTNYRSLVSNNSPLNESRTNSLSGIFNYRKAIQMFFLNAGVSYSKTILNTITSYQITNNTQQRIQIPLENSLQNFDFKIGASKYLFPLKTTLNIGFKTGFSKFTQFQNHELIPFTNTSSTFNLGFDTKISKSVNANYKGNYSHILSRTTSAIAIKNTINQFNQKGTLSINAFNNIYLNFSAEQIYTKQSAQKDLSYVFTDFNLKYRWIKYKTDLELNFNNIGNIKTFETVFVSANSLSRGQYQILGRIILLKTTFNF